MRRQLAPATIVLLLVASGCAQRRAAPAAGGDLDTLTEWMTGTFSSREQSRRDPDYRDIRLHMARIWPLRNDGVWFYVEQAAAEALDRPYRQRVYRVSEPARGVFVSAVYTLPGDPLRFAGGAHDCETMAELKAEDLTPRSGCEITLRRAADGSFVGGTSGTGCASELSGARYATSQVRITADGMETWDRGFDAAGVQVWGATKGPYVFRRVRPTVVAPAGD